MDNGNHVLPDFVRTIRNKNLLVSLTRSLFPLSSTAFFLSLRITASLRERGSQALKSIVIYCVHRKLLPHFMPWIGDNVRAFLVIPKMDIAGKLSKTQWGILYEAYILTRYPLQKMLNLDESFIISASGIFYKVSIHLTISFTYNSTNL